MTLLLVIEGVVLVLVLILLAGLLRSHAEILRRLEALGAGEDELDHPRAPIYRRGGPDHAVPESIGGPTPDGGAVSVALRGSRGLVLLAFLSSGCTTCRPFWQTFAGSFDLPGDDVRPIIVTKGTDAESPAQIAELAPATLPTVMSSEAWDAMKIPVSPYFVLVDAGEGNVVGEGAAATWPHVTDLLGQAMADAGMAGKSRTSAGTVARARRVDDDLRRAGIEAGDPSLYHNPHEAP